MRNQCQNGPCSTDPILRTPHPLYRTGCSARDNGELLTDQYRPRTRSLRTAVLGLQWLGAAQEINPGRALPVSAAIRKWEVSIQRSLNWVRMTRAGSGPAKQRSNDAP